MDEWTEAGMVCSTTHVLHLNFDCLWTIFEKLGLLDLCAVADVCTRWRETAQAVYQYSEFKSKLHVYSDLCSPHEYPDEILRRTSRVVRNFGEKTQSLYVNGTCYDFHELSQQKQQLYQRRLIDVLARYCKGTLDEVTISGFTVSSQVERSMRPLLRRLRKLKVQDCRGNLNLGHLKTSSKLTALEFECTSSNEQTQCFDEWCCHVPSMVSISFNGLHVARRNIAAILISNPQLKKIDFSSCKLLTDSIFKSIALYGPHIEAIQFHTRNPTTEKNIGYLGKVRNLKSLEVSGFEGNFKNIVVEIVAGGILLEHLHLEMNWIDPRHNAEQLVEEIVKLKTLKTLRLVDCKNLNIDHIMSVCNHLPELEELHLEYSNTNRCEFDLSKNDLLRFIELAVKLKVVIFRGFHLKRNARIDASTFLEMVGIVELRRERIPLHMELDVQTIVSHIPTEMARTYNDLLKLKISK